MMFEVVFEGGEKMLWFCGPLIWLSEKLASANIWVKTGEEGLDFQLPG
jgi:hypothetical protein